MTQAATMEGLLTEIRDSLAILVEASFPQYQKAVIERLGPLAETFRQNVNTAAQWDALSLMDGARNLPSVATATGIDRSNLAKLVARWKERKMVADGEKGPKCVLSVLEIRALKTR